MSSPSGIPNAPLESMWEERKEKPIKKLKPETVTELKQKLADARKAFSDYTRYEGCDCCRSQDQQDEAADKIGKLLGFNRYEDDSGWDWEWLNE